jgi:uncharacterized membrane protein
MVEMKMMCSLISALVAIDFVLMIDSAACLQCSIRPFNRHQPILSNEQKYKKYNIRSPGWSLSQPNVQLFAANDIDAHSAHEDNNIDTGVSASATIELPFSSNIAFDAFKDPIRQPSWSSWLKSVEYIDEIANPDITKWTIGLLGLKFSWTAKHTLRDRENGIIEWQSATGLQNRGRVTFIPIHNNLTTMKISMTFVTPRVVSKLLGNKKKALQRLVEERMLGQTLEKFRDVVLTNDVPLKEKQQTEN